MTILLNSTICAQGFTPAQPPSVNVIATWISQAERDRSVSLSNRWTPKTLYAALQTGQPVTLAPGWVLTWRAVEGGLG